MIRFYCRLLATSALALSGVAQAQDNASENHGLDEIIVTAQRRSESLTDVPLSIAAATGEALVASGINSVPDIKFQTPGFLAQSGTGYTQIYIRGIGNGVYVGADPSVASFVDDVPHVYGSLIDDLINVERVEVLKGAQGGLYGRNASGGVVNIITRQPGDDMAANVRVSVGQKNTVQASAYVNIPITDKIAVNLSGTRAYHNSYTRNLALDNPTPYPATANFFGQNLNAAVRPGALNNQDVYAVDGKIRFQATDTLKITIGADYANKHDAGGNGWRPKNQAELDAAYATYAGLAGFYGITPVPKWRLPNKNEAYGSLGEKSWTKDYGVSGKVELGLNGVDLTSISAYRKNSSQFQGDLGAAPVPFQGFSTNFKRQYVYQELRFVSNNDSRLHYLGGATYFKDKIDAFIDGRFFGYSTGPTTSTTRTRNYTVYGQLGYDITDKLSLTGSLRYANERKSVQFPDNPATLANDPDGNTTKVDKFIPSATLSYKIPGGNIYARYAKGFKTGGPNPLVRPSRVISAGTTLGLILAPETVDTYEVGYRAQLFDNKVQFTSAAFYNKYKGIHGTTSGQGVNADISNALINLGNARTYGGEASITWRVAEPLTISANIGYLNAHYQNAGFPGVPGVLLPKNAGNNRMANAPEWQGGFSAKYDQPISDSLRFSGNVLYSYISHYNYFYEENPGVEQPGYSLVNTRVGVVTQDDRLGVYVFANNIFNKFYTVYGTSASAGNLVTQGSPRIIGATLEFKY